MTDKCIKCNDVLLGLKWVLNCCLRDSYCNECITSLALFSSDHSCKCERQFTKIVPRIFITNESDKRDAAPIT